MGLRLRRTAEREGLAQVEGLVHAHTLAMEPRQAKLDDDHDPRYLHPGRTALVALTDGGLRDPAALAAALLLETLLSHLAVPAAALRKEGLPLLAEAAALRADVPHPFHRDVTERLVTAEARVRVVALSEWLDQLRHLRSWADADTVSQALRVTGEVYLPVAERTAPVLARRFRWWLRRVAPGLSASS